jgi:hypothetical protein
MLAGRSCPVSVLEYLERYCIFNRTPTAVHTKFSTLGAAPTVDLNRLNKVDNYNCIVDLRGVVISARARRAERGGSTIRFLKLYGDFSSMFMVKNGSETPRHGEPWELGDG